MIDIIIVFFGAVLLDYVWGKAVSAIAHSSALKAASWSAACAVIGGFITIIYVANPWMLIPAGVGAFVGVFISKVKK